MSYANVYGSREWWELHINGSYDDSYGCESILVDILEDYGLEGEELDKALDELAFESVYKTPCGTVLEWVQRD